MSSEKNPLPGFRRDLKIYNGPLEIDGSPTYNLYDPVTGKFFKISWKESLIFRSNKEGLAAEELAAKISSDFPVKVAVDDIKSFFFQALQLGLLKIPHDGQVLYQAHIRSKGSWSSWALQNYLFLKVPLFRPDAFLAETLPYLKFLGSRLALFIYTILVVIGFVLILDRSEKFFHTFSYFFNLEGVIFYACAITCVKCIHELSHAYTAKNFGLYVPTMGIALLVLWPVLFTDVTEGWKLSNRRERFFISFAGVASELVMAALATIAWLMSSPGLLQSLCFVIASTSWFSTIVVNVNPAVRFDGYYILSDLWGIDNLMQRAFAFTRWKMHRWLFGIQQECPEENISTRRAAGFIFFTFYTILYRFFLYTAIALFVYYEFTKILGMFLFLAEIWIFFLMPVVWEIKTLYQLRSTMPLNFRSILTITLFAMAACWFFIPFPHQMTFPGVVTPKEKQIIYAPESGKITEILIKNGQKVTQGAPLIQIESESLQLEISQLQQNQQILSKELLVDSNSPEAESYISGKKAEIAQNEQKLLALSKKEEQLTVRADHDGTAVNWNTLLNPGQYVYEGQIFGSVADISKIEVIAFIKETQIDDIKIGQKAQIVFLDSTLHFMQAEVINIDRKRVKELIYPALSSIYRGPLAVDVRKTGTSGGALLLHDSYYQTTLSLDDPQANLFLGKNVEVRIRGPWRSYFVEVMKYIYLAVFKESSF